MYSALKVLEVCLGFLVLVDWLCFVVWFGLCFFLTSRRTTSLLVVRHTQY